MSSIRRALGALRRARAARHRVPPRIRFGPETEAPAQIYYLSPDPPGPRGGVRVFYRHVDLLNDAGLSAAVVHRRRGYRASWFANVTRVIAGPDIVVTPRDTLVVPEFYGAMIRTIPVGPRVVLFNQAPYYTFDGLQQEDLDALEARPDSAVLTVSADAAAILRLVFDGLPVSIARPVIDGGVFHPGAAVGGRRRIAFAANRLAQERDQLLGLLQRRGRVADWELVPIHGLSEQQVADALRRCAIFLSFSDRDGFGLPPAEAMACGCFVIGHHGGGGREFFDPRFSEAVTTGDLGAYLEAVERAAVDFDEDATRLTEAGLQASAAVLSRYSASGLRDDLVSLYAGLGAAQRS